MNNGFMQWLLPTLLNGLFGVAAGVLALMIVIPVQRLFKR
jgi:predicted DNA repair protein MutK